MEKGQEPKKTDNIKTKAKKRKEEKKVSGF